MARTWSGSGSALGREDAFQGDDERHAEVRHQVVVRLAPARRLDALRGEVQERAAAGRQVPRVPGGGPEQVALRVPGARGAAGVERVDVVPDLAGRQRDRFGPGELADGVVTPRVRRALVERQPALEVGEAER